MTVTTLPASTSGATSSAAQDDSPGAVARRFTDALQHYFQTGDSAPIEGLVAPNFANHIPGMPGTRQDLLQALAAFRAALPDLRLTVNDILVDGDRVVDQVHWTATHSGPMMGIPATGKQVTVGEIHISRVANGQIVERWGEWDSLGMLQQLGVVPPPQQG